MIARKNPAKSTWQGLMTSKTGVRCSNHCTTYDCLSEVEKATKPVLLKPINDEGPLQSMAQFEEKTEMKSNISNWIWALFLIACLSCLTGSAIDAATEPRQPVQLFNDEGILESTVMILARNSKGEESVFGAGVLLEIDTLYLITARHLFLARDSVVLESYVFGNKDDGAKFFTKANRTLNWKSCKYYCPTTPDSDFVAIQMPAFSRESQIVALTLKETVAFEDLKYAEQVFYYGFPAYEEFRLSETKWRTPLVGDGSICYFVTEVVPTDPDKSLIPGVILLNGLSMPGNSGGPVFIRRPFVIDRGGIQYDRRLAAIMTGHLGSPSADYSNPHKAIAFAISDIVDYIKRMREKERPPSMGAR